MACNGNGPLCDIENVFGAVGSIIDSTIGFATDPLGYLAQQMQMTAYALASSILPAIVEVTHPDVTAAWFIGVWRVSMVFSIFLGTVLLLWSFVQVARHKITGDDLLDSFIIYLPIFLFGIAFGPAFGATLLKFTGALMDTLLMWGVSGSADQAVGALQDAIVAASPDRMAGGSIAVIVLMFGMCLALILVAVVLIMMLVTLYASGSVVPVNLAYLLDATRREKGIKLVVIWAGICFSAALLVFMLGVAFHLISGMTTDFGNPGMQIFVNVVVGVIMLSIAALSPYALIKFAAGVGPSSPGGAGASFPNYRRTPARVRGGFPESPSDSQTAQMSRAVSDNHPPEDVDGFPEGSAAASAAGGRRRAPGWLRREESPASSVSAEAPAAAREPAGATSARETPVSADDQAPGTLPTDTGSLAAGAQSTGKKVRGFGDKAKTVGAVAAAVGGTAGAAAGAAIHAVGTGAQVAGEGLSKAGELARAAADKTTRHMDQG